MNISSDCRTSDGVVIGLIDGIIAMCRVIASSDLSSMEIQEALKDLVNDEDLKIMLNQPNN